jgi:NAD(P)H-dependent flavin oxidoreductase YrpB (nitropropane dioxygenase family)
MALRTKITEPLGIDHPVVLGGMGSGGTGHELGGHNKSGALVGC